MWITKQNLTLYCSKKGQKLDYMKKKKFTSNIYFLTKKQNLGCSRNWIWSWGLIKEENMTQYLLLIDKILG